MKRAAFAALAVVAAVGLLARSAAPVAACTCVLATPEAAVARAQIVLVGVPVSLFQTPSRIVQEGDTLREYGARTMAEVKAERYLKGTGPDTIEVLSDICLGGVDPAQIGQRHLLFLYFYNQFDKVPTASDCLGSAPLDRPLLPISLSQVEAITGPGEPPNDSLDEPRPPDAGGFPLVAAAAIAIAGPAAFLLGAAFLWPSRRSAL